MSLVIDQEAIHARVEVKTFDHSNLKHVETSEKNPLPTPQTLREELRPDILQDVSEVKGFNKDSLKHVDTSDKTVIPTQEGKFL